MDDIADQKQSAPIFISYSASDLPWARWVDWQLRSIGHVTVMQHYDHEQGGDVDRQIAQAIATCEIVLALLSPAYERSTWCPREWERADQLDKLRQLVVRPYAPGARYARRSYKDVHGKSEPDAARALRELIEGTPRPSHDPGLPPAQPAFPGARRAPWQLALGAGIVCLGAFGAVVGGKELSAREKAANPTSGAITDCTSAAESECRAESPGLDEDAAPARPDGAAGGSSLTSAGAIDLLSRCPQQALSEGGTPAYPGDAGDSCAETGPDGSNVRLSPGQPSRWLATPLSAPWEGGGSFGTAYPSGHVGRRVRALRPRFRDCYQRHSPSSSSADSSAWRVIIDGAGQTKEAQALTPAVHANAALNTCLSGLLREQLALGAPWFGRPVAYRFSLTPRSYDVNALP